MYEKGILRRQLESRAFRYFPKFTEEEQVRTSVETAARLLISETPLPPSVLVDAAGERGAEMLEELERIVKAKRAALHRKDHISSRNN